MIVTLPTATAANPSAGYVRLFDPLGGTVVRLPWMPEEIETGDLAQVWEQVERPARFPLLIARGKSLPTVNLTARLIQPNGVDHVQGTVDALTKLSKSSNPIRLDVAQQYRGLFRITALSVLERDWDTAGRPTDAEATLELTKSSDMAAAVGPIKRRTIHGKVGGAARRKKK